MHRVGALSVCVSVLNQHWHGSLKSATNFGYQQDNFEFPYFLWRLYVPDPDHYRPDGVPIPDWTYLTLSHITSVFTTHFNVHMYMNTHSPAKRGRVSPKNFRMTSSSGNIFRVTGPLWGESSPVDSPHNSEWRGALIFSLMCAWTNGWAKDWDAEDLRGHGTHCDVTVMCNWHT